MRGEGQSFATGKQHKVGFFMEKKNHDKNPEIQRDQLCRIMDALDFPMVRISYPDFKMIGMNQKAAMEICRIKSWDPSELLVKQTGHPIVDIFPEFAGEENDQYICEMIRQKKPTYRNELEILRGNEKAYVNLIYQPVLDEQHEIKEFTVVCIDITKEVKERTNVENMLQVQNQFISFITHEFKTPLTVINAAVQAMEFICRDELTDKSKDFISKIRENAFRQLRLVNNLLDITRAEEGYLNMNLRNVDIVALTRSIVESVSLYAEANGINMQFTTEIPYRMIGIDEEKYERILLNLLSNAIKFTERGKNIGVYTGLQEGGIYIQVVDEGIGIPEEKQKKIFERFGQVDGQLTRQTEGSGIGLYLVTLLIKALEGTLHLDSEVGRGSTFTVVLPDRVIDEHKKEILLEGRERHRQAIATEFSGMYSI